METSRKLWAIIISAAALVGCQNNSPPGTHPSDGRPPDVKENPPGSELSLSPEFEQFARERGYNPRAHHEVLAYFRKLWAGEPRDATFEAKSLSTDLNFKLLNFAELVVAMSRALDLPVDEAILFVSITTNPKPLPEGILTRKVADLIGKQSEEERARKLLGGADTKEMAVRPLVEPLGRVESLLKYCVAIETWCRKDKPSRFPSLTADAPTAPPHMKGQHPDSIRIYRERQQELGKPWEEATTTAVVKFIVYELKRDKKKGLNADQITRTTNLTTDLGLDQLDFVEMLMNLEEHYDARIRFDYDSAPTSVGDVLDAIDKQLSNRK